MSYKTNSDLIQEQMNFWDEDLSVAGDEIFMVVELIPLADLVLPDFEVISIYEQEGKDQETITRMSTAMKANESFPPILIDKVNNILDGYHRYLAALSLGMADIPCIRLNRDSARI